MLALSCLVARLLNCGTIPGALLPPRAADTLHGRLVPSGQSNQGVTPRNRALIGDFGRKSNRYMPHADRVQRISITGHAYKRFTFLAPRRFSRHRTIEDFPQHKISCCKFLVHRHPRRQRLERY
ncbi:hypothetical protein TWF225_010922 [Orbilia oligospora]|uniref:Uncharacterized protein n=1 Tax=Orbilia oligospora TaxID=2813651 RepID=A0A7C8KIG0_ORBOL|nr:hypothetical protein TWF751_005295 [Orbilia oligospora]KAF3193071.1 hypothetical protein TWF225_010922 [Orbilia oligospora]KAF3265768.1 hypothetical protein TWF217_002304 [Orbilia oligospora]KAF3271531.1 hypothetical protein TWF128_000113 [Orbilia oligospora]KAF3295024.1 hypothetical protein TWF132_002354 [Orbilia oligospora]